MPINFGSCIRILKPEERKCGVKDNSGMLRGSFSEERAAYPFQILCGFLGLMKRPSGKTLAKSIQEFGHSQ